MQCINYPDEILTLKFDANLQSMIICISTNSSLQGNQSNNIDATLLALESLAKFLSSFPYLKQVSVLVHKTTLHIGMAFQKVQLYQECFFQGLIFGRMKQLLITTPVNTQLIYTSEGHKS